MVVVNRGVKHLNNWLDDNKSSLRKVKYELLILKSPRKVLPDEIKINLMEKSFKLSKIIRCKD